MLLPESGYFSTESERHAMRSYVRNMGSISKAGVAFFAKTRDPFVTGFFAYSKRNTELGNREAATECMTDKLFAGIHEIRSPPGHDNLQSGACPIK